MQNHKFCVSFAGVVGCSKSQIAHYLSCKFNLPIFSNDAIRKEIYSNFLFLDQEKYLKLRDSRLEDLLKTGNSFIYDSSVDRSCKERISKLKSHHYDWFIISLDLSKDFLTQLYKVKGYDRSLARLESLLLDHANFLKEFGSEVDLHIKDETFKDRLILSENALKNWLKDTSP